MTTPAPDSPIALAAWLRFALINGWAACCHVVLGATLALPDSNASDFVMGASLSLTALCVQALALALPPPSRGGRR